MENTCTTLTPRQKRFCELYATSEEFFGNGVKAYIAAFSTKTKPVKYESAKVNASKLLAEVSVQECINRLLEEKGLNDQFIDKQLLFLVTQHADLHLKLAAIKEYNKMKGRWVKNPDNDLDEQIVYKFGFSKTLIHDAEVANANAPHS